MPAFLQLAKALSDESRVRALLMLDAGELCLCQIIEVLGLSPSTVSKHMSILHDAGLIQRRKAGRWQYFRLACGEDGSVGGMAQDAIALARQHLAGTDQAKADLAAVKRAQRVDPAELCGCYDRSNG